MEVIPTVLELPEQLVDLHDSRGAHGVHAADEPAAEVGRQPWIVYNQLRTSQAVSQNLGASQVLGSIVMFTVIYAMLFVLWIYLLNDKIQKGPETK